MRIFKYKYEPKGQLKKRKKTTEIILHCSATKEGKDFKTADIDKWHRDQGWTCVGYNYVIELDGTIVEARGEEYVGAHCTGHNSFSIGICYIGGVDEAGISKDTRTAAQKEAMIWLIKWLLKKYNLKIQDVHCHNEYCKKACPSFSRNKMLLELWAAMDA